MSFFYPPLPSEKRVNNGSLSASGLLDIPQIDKRITEVSLTSPLNIDGDSSNRETVSNPYTGADGLFPNEDKDGHPDVDSINPERPELPRPDVEIISSPSKDSEPVEPPDEAPDPILDIALRSGSGGESSDDFDGKHDNPNRPLSPFKRSLSFPYSSGYMFPYGHDLEVGSIPGDLQSIPDVNVYQHKKTLAQGMMDLALFSANANQLRYVLESFSRHPYYSTSLGLISVSLALQVAVGIGLIWNATYNVKNEKEIGVANRINNFTVIGIFLVTVVNVFISAFGVTNTSENFVTKLNT